MEYKRKWESICEKMETYKFISEKELQLLIEVVLEYELGWQKSKGEITRQSIHFDSQNYGIPDAILRKNGVNVLCIELKKYMVGLNENNEKQLFSYMRALKLPFGILWGSSIKVFYDKPNDNQEPVKVCEIKFSRSDELGEKLVEQLVKENFSTENFESFCNKLMDRNEVENKTENEIKFLCSPEGEKIVKDFLLTKYSEEIIDCLSVKIYDKREKPSYEPKIKHRYTNIGRNVPEKWIEPNIASGFSRDGRTIQDWIKDVLSEMCFKNLISEGEFDRLHDLEYCKQTFGLQFPLLCDDEEGVWYGNHARYWTTWKLKNKYFVCSQWWKQNEKNYEYDINRWIDKIVKNSEKK